LCSLYVVGCDLSAGPNVSPFERRFPSPILAWVAQQANLFIQVDLAALTSHLRPFLFAMVPGQFA
jgi:hypothetical protein